MQLMESPYKKLISVCVNRKNDSETLCGNRNSEEIFFKLKNYVREKGLIREVMVSRSLCLGQCGKGPIITVQPDDIWYMGITLEDCSEIIKKHIDIFI